MKASELMQAMADAGAPMEAILIALRAVEERDEAIEHRRAGDRERKRRQRAGGEKNTGTVTGQSRDIPETVTVEAPLSRPPNDIYSNPPTHTPEKQTPRARKADDFPKPGWADAKVWRDLLKNRRTKRLPNTETAHSAFVAKVENLAEDGWPPGEVLRAIVAKGWGGAHDPRDEGNPRNGKDIRQRGTSGPDKRSGLARAIDSGLQRTQSAFPENLTLVGGDAAAQGW